MLWDKRPSEPQEAYEAFGRFRDAGVFRKLHQPGIAVYKLGEWAKKFEWQKRANAFDKHIDDLAEKIAKPLPVIEKIDDVVREAAMHAVALAKDQLEKWRRRAMANAEVDIELPLRDIIKVLETAAKLVQLLDGKPTENVNVIGDPTWTDEHFREVEDAIKRAEQTKKN